MRRCAGAILVVVCSLWPSVARADAIRDECAVAYERAQRLRQSGQLVASRQQLLVCTRDACPAVAKADCARWLSEVERSLPTVVVSAKDGDGNDIVDAKLSIDDQPVAARLDGRAREIDPGPHSLRCEAAGVSVVQSFVTSEGEKNREIVVRFSKVAPREPAPAVAPPTRGGGVPAGAFVLGGLAIGALSTFAYFGLSGKSVEKCAPTCARAEVDEFRRDYLIADVALITGIVATAGALWVALTAKPAPAVSRAQEPWFRVAPRAAGTANACF